MVIENNVMINNSTSTKAVAGGVTYDTTEAKSFYNEENETYTLIFNTGAKLEYKEQHPTGAGIYAYSAYNEDGGISDTLYNLIGATFTASESQEDNISMFNCTCCSADLRNNVKDTIEITNINEILGFNIVKYGRNDTIIDNTAPIENRTTNADVWQFLFNAGETYYQE